MPVSKKLTASAAVSRFSECLTYSETRKKAAFAKPMSGKCAQEGAAPLQTIGLKSR
jgi:hypothetical protein